MSAVRKQAIKTVQNILETQKVEDYLANPRIPEVLSNPSFLVVPKLGSLVTIDVQEIPADKNWWSITLALLEDLFDVKVSTGAQTCCVLVVISDLPEYQEWDSRGDALRLLQKLFDQVILLPTKLDVEISILRKNLSLVLDRPHAKEDLFTFWQEETHSRQANYERISELSFVRRTLETFQVEEDDKPVFFEPITDKKSYIKHLSLGIQKNTDLFVKQNVKVLNIKEQLIGRQYYFPFELMVLPEKNLEYEEEQFIRGVEFDRFTRNNGSLLKVFFGSQGTFRNKEQLRKLAVYSRFISYEVREGTLRLRPNPPSLFILLVNDLWGPDFAPSRYIQMLISAGWKPIRPDDLTRENLLTR